MTESAIETFSIFGVIVLCTVLGVITLSTYYRIMARFAGDEKVPDKMALRGVLNERTWVTVHMQGGETFENVRIIGFSSSFGAKGSEAFPYDLGTLIILEDKSGRRMLPKAKAVRMIVIEPDGQSA